jgi:hypothetical protein
MSGNRGASGHVSSTNVHGHGCRRVQPSGRGRLGVDDVRSGVSQLAPSLGPLDTGRPQVGNSLHAIRAAPLLEAAHRRLQERPAVQGADRLGGSAMLSWASDELDGATHESILLRRSDVRALRALLVWSPELGSRRHRPAGGTTGGSEPKGSSRSPGKQEVLARDTAQSGSDVESCSCDRSPRAFALTAMIPAAARRPQSTLWRRSGAEGLFQALPSRSRIGQSPRGGSVLAPGARSVSRSAAAFIADHRVG